jgi:hypothetical protein
MGQLLAAGFEQSGDLALLLASRCPWQSLGKRAAMGLVQGGPGKSAAMGGAISAAAGAGGA